MSIGQQVILVITLMITSKGIAGVPGVSFVVLAFSESYCFSHLLITSTASALPTTFNAVRAISIIRSIGQQVILVITLMITSKGIAGVPGVSFVVLLATSIIRSTPAINAKPSSGIPTVCKVANRTTNDTPGTGYSFNLDGSTLYQSIAAIFIAQLYGIDMSIGQQEPVGITKLEIAFGAP
jgi:Na+/H+-dicarboxylate symporter